MPLAGLCSVKEGSGRVDGCRGTLVVLRTSVKDGSERMDAEGHLLCATPLSQREGHSEPRRTQ